MSAETKTTEVPKKMTAWALFMDRVASLTPLPRSEVMQLSSYLKGQKDMIAWKDAEIIAAIPEWTASKAAEAKKEEVVPEKSKRKTKEAKEEGVEVPEKPKRKAKEPKEAKEAKEAKETKKGSAAAGEEDPSSEPATAASAPAPSTSSVVEMLELQLNQTKKKLDTAKAELSKAESDAKVLVDRATEARAKAKALTKEAEEACLITAKSQTVVYELETEVAAKKVEFEKAEAAAAAVAAAAAAFQQATNSSASVAVAVSTPAAPSPEEEAAEPLHVRRKKIPSSIRTLVWNKYIAADVAQSDCFCCRTAKISVRSFDCGHVIAEAKGGDLTINNLRPICKDCNKSMGTRSMNEFTKEYFGWTV